MTYAQLASDLPPDRTTTFWSAEENEETMRRLGVDQQVRQLGRGAFRVDLAVEGTEHAELYSDRFSTAFTMSLAAPEGHVGFLFLRGARDRVLVCGEEVADDKLVVAPPGSSVDIVGPDLTASEAITLPAERFESVARPVCPAPWLDQLRGTTVIPGNTEKLHDLRRGVLDLVQHPERDPRQEQRTRLLAETIAWIDESFAGYRPECHVVNGAHSRVARRVQQFLEEHYWDSVHMEDLCRTAGVGIRTAQRCFREYFDLTITDYLKTLRLNAARRDLAAAAPSQTSVTTIALEHGFGHLGRFSVEFRDRFGESPSETLARMPVRAA